MITISTFANDEQLIEHQEKVTLPLISKPQEFFIPNKYNQIEL